MWPFQKKTPSPDRLPIDGPWSAGEGHNDGKVMIVRSQFVFYTRAPQQLQHRFEQLRSRITSHQIQLMIQLDNTWGIYRQLGS